MDSRPLAVSDVLLFVPVMHADERGSFTESYRRDALERATGRTFPLEQMNTSVSERGVFRGIHYAIVPPGQAKYVSVLSGSIIDYVVDLRVGSPTFAVWDSVALDDRDRRSLFIPEGVGHAFLSTDDRAVVSYAVSDIYRPDREFSVSLRGHEIGEHAAAHSAVPLRLSQRDEEAPTIAEARAAGRLPDWEQCRARYAELSP